MADLVFICPLNATKHSIVSQWGSTSHSTPALVFLLYTYRAVNKNIDLRDYWWNLESLKMFTSVGIFHTKLSVSNDQIDDPKATRKSIFLPYHISILMKSPWEKKWQRRFIKAKYICNRNIVIRTFILAIFNATFNSVQVYTSINFRLWHHVTNITCQTVPFYFIFK